VVLEGTIADMLQSELPWVKQYFRGTRARAISGAHQMAGAR
jgi:ABC-type transporter Mla maintaining outer membrane lipid asymmetry ATPase subunit MlaF